MATFLILEMSKQLSETKKLQIAFHENKYIQNIILVSKSFMKLINHWIIQFNIMITDNTLQISMCLVVTCEASVFNLVLKL